MIRVATPLRRVATGRNRPPQVGVGVGRRHPAPRRALQEALLDQVGLDDVLDRFAFLADRGGEVVEPDGPPAELVQDRAEQRPVHEIESGRVDVEHAQGGIGDAVVDQAVRAYLGIVAHAAQQAQRDARRAPRPEGDLLRAGAVDGHLEHLGGPLDDVHQRVKPALVGEMVNQILSGNAAASAKETA